MMNNYKSYITILFLCSFLLTACSEDKQGNTNLNNEEKQKDIEEQKDQSSENSTEDIENETSDSIDIPIEDDKSSESIIEKAEMNDSDIEEIVADNYEKVIQTLNENESAVSDIFNNNAETMDYMAFMESGVDPNDPFYDDMYTLLYPQVENIVAEQGMKDLINTEFLLFNNPRNATPFSPTFDRLEIVEKNDSQFKIKKIATMSDSDQLIYIVEFIKEDDKWKFYGAKISH